MLAFLQLWPLISCDQAIKNVWKLCLSWTATSSRVRILLLLFWFKYRINGILISKPCALEIKWKQSLDHFTSTIKNRGSQPVSGSRAVEMIVRKCRQVMSGNQQDMGGRRDPARHPPTESLKQAKEVPFQVFWEWALPNRPQLSESTCSSTRVLETHLDWYYKLNGLLVTVMTNFTRVLQPVPSRLIIINWPISFNEPDLQHHWLTFSFDFENDFCPSCWNINHINC